MKSKWKYNEDTGLGEVTFEDGRYIILTSTDAETYNDTYKVTPVEHHDELAEHLASTRKVSVPGASQRAN